MSDLIQRASQALSLLSDSSLAKHLRIERAMQSFSGLVLSDLDRDIRDELEHNLGGVMAVTQATDFEESESLECIEEADLDRCSDLLREASQDAIEAECERLIQELDQAEGKLPVQTILSIRQHRDLMIPRLIGCIEEATAEVRSAPNLETGSAHFFAIFLLSEFNAREALPVILEALKAPGESPFIMFGDLVYEIVPEILAQLAMPSLDCLMPLIEDRQVNRYVRVAVMNAYCQAMTCGAIQRQEVLERMQYLIRRTIEYKDSDLATGIVCCLLEMGPKECMEDIRLAYKMGLVDASLISLKSLEAESDRSEAIVWKSTNRKQQLGISDCLEALHSWVDFEPPTKPSQKPRVERVYGQRESIPMSAGSHSNTLAKVHHPGRNDLCPCGSNKKYKKCCGK